MIKTLSDLLRSVQFAEAQRLDKHRITHGPTIGTMYEGLTKELIDRTLPPELDIRVLDGFIDGVDTPLSAQADILVVRGDGEQIPHTQSYIYPVQQVLAVFEIKKRLGGSALDDAMMKMGAVIDRQREWNEVSDEDVDLRPAAMSFALTSGHWPLSDEAAAVLPAGLPVIFDLFKIEQTAPVRVIWGYGGYKSEQSLRTGFVRRMNAVADKSNYVPLRLPSLVVAGQNSLVKMVGQPYSSRVVGGWWNVLTSNHENPVRLLLELLWTKISVTMGVHFPMDDSLDMERLAPFLAAKFPRQGNDFAGVEYRQVELTKSELKSLPSVEWRPEDHSLDEAVLMMMCTANGLDISDDGLKTFATQEQFDLEQAVSRLVERRLLAWTSATTLRPIESTSITAFSPNGSIATASNPDLINLWIQKVAAGS